MKTKLILAVLILTFGFSAAFSQGVIIRVLSYNGPGNQIDEVTDMIMDAYGSVLVTGFSTGTNSGEDFATIKFNNSGDFLWVSRFNGTGNNQDRATAIALDVYGNVYVTGWGYMEPSAMMCGSIDFITIKYNSFGQQMWVKTYNGTGGGTDKAVAIVLDASGNVYVGGTSGSSSNAEDYVIIKYNNNGAQQWVARYDGVSHGADFLNAMVLDGFGNIIATGSSYKSGNAADYITVKYNSSGVLQLESRYNGPASTDDKAYSIAADVHGNYFVTGASKGSGSNYDYATIKYNSAGNQLWLKRYNGPGNNIDEAHKIVIDPYGYSYVTGFSKGSTTNYDYTTFRYDPDGNQMWIKTYNNSTNGNDVASDMKIVKRLCSSVYDYPCWNFDIYVTGKSEGSGSGYDYLTVKYDELGTFKWACRYTSSGSVEDVSNVIAVRDELPYLYVGGRLNNNYGILQISAKNGETDYFANNEKPVSFKLGQNYPNPFNPVTIISYDIPKDEFVEIKVYDLLGREVAELVSENQISGTYDVKFNASNLPSGTYIYTIKAGANVESKKMVLIK